MPKHVDRHEDEEFPDTVPTEEEHILINYKSEVPMAWQVRAAVEAYRIIEETALARIAQKRTTRDKTIALLKTLNHLILTATLNGEYEPEIRAVVRERTDRPKEEETPKRRGRRS